MKNILLAVFLVSLLSPATVSAIHKSQVAGKVIDSDDQGVYEAHEPNCAYRHYHGTLNGAADPAPQGCGHGEVTLIAHGEGDGESIPAPKEKGAWESFTAWVGSWFTKENAKNVVDVAAEATGNPPPFQTAEVVDITKEATPSIMEKAENVKEYRATLVPAEDTMGIYSAPSSGGNPDGSDTLSQKFFKWLNGLFK